MALDAAPVVAPAPAGRAGRDLPAAIAVSLGLGAVVLASLYLYKPAFLAVLVVSVLVGLWELTQALAAAHHRVGLLPLAVGGTAAVCLSYVAGSEGMVVALLLTGAAVVVARLPEGRDRVLPDVAAGLLTLVWVPGLASFAALLLIPADGADRVVAFIATVVCSDVAGYAAGVLAGRHPMAPRISPKKSWEGFVGSLVACAGGGALLFALLLHARALDGAGFGLAIAFSATLGDLGESMVKRDIGIKDMGRLLPGHGGLMDRLDSLLPSAPVAYLLLTLFLPHGR